MKLYLAGPMRGYKDFNFAAFDRWAERLRAAGYDVFSPAEHDRETMLRTRRTAAQLTIRECMEADTRWICQHADGIALLDGWQASKGANAEVALAHAIGIPVYKVRTWIGAAEREAVAA